MTPAKHQQNWLPGIFNDFFGNEWIAKTSSAAPVFEKEEDMVLAKQYMLAEDKKNLTEIEALRVIARFDPDTNMFKITSVIPDKHWDY